MTKTHRSQKQKLFSLVTSLVVLGGIVTGVYAWISKPAQAAWFDDTWAYRQKSTITNSGTAQADYPILITMDTSTLITAGKMQSDCDDIRVTDVSGKLLNHYVEYYCNQTYTKLWVKVPSIPTTNQTLYIYYGNPTAPNADKIDEIFDTNLSNRWEFNTEGNQESWGGENQLTGLRVSGGVFSMTSSGTDPYVQSPAGLSITASSTDYIFIKTRITAGHDTASVYWHTNLAGSYSESRVKYHVVAATGQWQVLAVNVATGTGWADTVTRFRFDPTFQTASSVEIDWIRVQNSGATPPTAGSPGTEEKGEGPISYWKFDEGADNKCSGGANDACDSMGKEDTVFGASTAAPTWKTEDMCVSGKCLLFDGSNDYANSASTINFGVKVITLDFWLKWQTYADDFDLAFELSSDSNENDGTFYISPNASGGVWEISMQDSATTYKYRQEQFARHSAGVWHHYSIVLDNSTNAGDFKFYVDGAEQKPSSETSTKDQSSNIKTDTLYFMSRAGSSLFGNGYLDEVKIYPYERTAAQIKTDYASRGSTPGIGAALGANRDNNTALSNGLAGYWKLDGTSGNAADSSGYGSTLTNTGTTTFTTGKFGNAPDMNGTTQYFTLADNAALSTGDIDFSLSTWFYLDVLNVDQTLISKENAYGGGTTAEYRLDFTDSGDTVRWTVFDSNHNSVGQVASSAIIASTWYHVVVWHDAVNNKVGLQLNNGRPVTADTTGSPSDTAATFFLGARGGPNDLQNGRLDEVRFYKRALDNAERTFLYNWAPGPVGYWKFDENDGSSAYDSSGNSYTLAQTSTTYQPGKFGSGIKFDNVNDGALCTDANCGGVTELELDSTSITGFTLEAWIYPTDTTSNYFISKVSGGGQGFALRRNTEGFSYFFGDSTCSNNSTTTGVTSGYPINSWYHVAVTLSTANPGTAILYVNGTQVATSGSNYYCNVADDFNIGNPGQTAFGTIDEVKVYHYVRSTSQLVEDMNGGHPLGGSPVGSQVGYWSLDEQQGTVTNDKGFGANNGTLGTTTAAPTWKTAGSSNCKINGCLSFDGGDYVTFGDQDELETNEGQGITISTWAKSSDWVDSGPEMLIAKFAGDADGDFYLGVYQNKARALIIGQSGTGKVTNSTSNLTNGAWTHLAMTWSGASTDPILLYVNGILAGTPESNGTITAIADTAEPLFLGTRTNAAKSAFFNGQIDEPKIYNSALTADEIKIDYNAGSAVALGGVLGTQDNEGFGGNPPKAYWAMNENKDNSCTGGTNDVCDLSGNGNDGAKTSVSATTWVPGKMGSGLRFDGTANEVTVNDTPFDFERTDDFTIQAWVKSTKANGSTIVIKDDGSNTGYKFFYEDTSGFPRIWIESTSTNRIRVDGSIGILDGNWHHVAVTYDGSSSSNGVKFYTDGVLNVNSVDENTLTTSILNNSNLKIGCAQTCITSDAWQGDLDEIKIYDYVRTQAQIIYDFNRGAPAYHYKFDECQGATAYNAAVSGSGLAAGTNGTISPGDSSGDNDTTGTCSSGTSTEMWNDGTTGKVNNSLGFDGTNDIVDLSTGAGLLSATGDYSISAWIYPTDITSTIIYGQGNSANTTQALRFDIASNNKLDFSLINDSDVAVSLNSTSSIVASTWTHVAVTKSGSSIKMYINGVLDRSGFITTSGTYTFNTSSIGYLNRSSDTEYFAGQIDEMRIYRYPLSDDQVKQLFNNGAVYFGPATGSP